MANNGNDEEIIEKSSSEPVANACLILGAIALLGGMIFQIMEISEVRSTLTASERALESPHVSKLKSLTSDFSSAVKKAIDENAHPELKLDGGAAPETGGNEPRPKEEEPAADEKDAGKDTEKDAQPPSEEKTEEKPEEKPEEKTAEKTDEKAEPTDEATDAPAKDKDAEASDPK